MVFKICTAWVATLFLAGILASAAESRDEYYNNYVAAVVTSKRVFAWAWGRSDFKEERLRRNENVQFVDTSPHTVTIGTDRRVLVFKSGGVGWREF